MPKRDDDSINLDALPSLQADKRLDENTSKTNQSVTKADKSRLASKSTPWLLWCITICLLLACICLALYSYQQQQLIDKSEARLAALEGRLSTTDESLSQSSVAMQLRLVELKERTDELWTQMDKLWASAWRRNQTELKDLSKQFSETEKTVKSFASDNAAFKKHLATLESNLKQQAQAATKLEKQFTSQAHELKTLNNKTAAIESQLLQLEGVEQKFAQLQKQQQQVQQQITEINEWLESNNAFRKKTNQTLNQLDARMKSLHPTE